VEPKPLFSGFLLLKTSISTVLRNLCLICYCFVCSHRSGPGRVGLGPVLVLRRARRTLIIVILLLFLLSSLLLLSCFSPAFTIHIFLPRRQLCSNATTAATNNTQ
jgi:hypothetical protein